MNPVLRSERPWSMKVVFGNVTNEGIRPERFTNTSIISVESAIMDGDHEMSPFDFDTYTCILMGSDADSIRVGVTIRGKQVNTHDKLVQWRLVYLNCRTRLINSINTEVNTSFNQSRPNDFADEEAAELDIVRTQRYNKKYKSVIPKLPMNYRSQVSISVEQKVDFMRNQCL